MSLLPYLHRVTARENLSFDDAFGAMNVLLTGEATPVEISAFLVALKMKGETSHELAGFVRGMREHMIRVDAGDDVVDNCGTGGDASGTFNISTTASFVMAGAGAHVAKHGNRSISSATGAADVLEALGVSVTLTPEVAAKQIREIGIGFLFAPAFHPSIKHVQPIRRELKIRTVFNLLGPMANPAQPAFQLVGVYNLEMARIYNYLLQLTDRAFTIIHGLDGYDEISLTNDTKVITNGGERIYTPEELGKRMVSATDIYGGNTVEEAAKLFTKILKAEGSWAQSSVVLANAAMALNASGRFEDYGKAYEAAVESLESGKAYGALEKLIALQ